MDTPSSIFPRDAAATGKGATIYILDTGFDVSGWPSEWKTSGQYDFTGTSPQDTHGHGTCSASAAAGAYFGVAKDASLVNMKIGVGSNVSSQAATKAINTIFDLEAVEHIGNPFRPNPVISMSFTVPNDRMLSAAIKKFNGRAAFIAGAGNKLGDGANNFPCGMDGVICVGATDKRRNRWKVTVGSVAYGSAAGSKVRFIGPGSGVSCAWLGGKTKTSVQGTSFLGAFGRRSCGALPVPRGRPNQLPGRPATLAEPWSWRQPRMETYHL